MSDTRTRFTAFITRFALTDGITQVLVEDCFHISEGMVKAVEDKTAHSAAYHGKDWHRTREAAVKRANEMRDAKIRSIEKSLVKMRSLKFS